MSRFALTKPVLILAAGIALGAAGNAFVATAQQPNMQAALNSLQLLPPALVATLVEFDTALLAMAMAALGLRTHLGAVRQAGPRPLLLAAVLFGVLLLGGRALVAAVAWAG